MKIGSNCELIGSFPGERLPLYNNLRILVLSNSFTNNGVNLIPWTIPTQIGSLSSLELFILSEAEKLVGSIPNEIGMLQNLQDLQLSFNDLTGSLPTQMSNMISLTALRINWNNLIGPIPVGFASLPALEVLELIYNSLTGKIPWSNNETNSMNNDSIIKQLNLVRINWN